ncbi:MAG TPA: ATP-binding protein [Mucilaginibacter sp.]|jgi:signal transduction histidine kinase|nr:ATP-binding protein [Mucilaginibacter sp.]
MRKSLAILIFLTLCTAVSAQQKAIDSLKKQIVAAKDDTTHALLMCQLGSAYLYSKPDSSLLLAQQGLQLSKAAQFQKGEAIALTLQGNVYDVTGNYSKALSMLLESLKISEQINNQYDIEKNLHDMSNVYSDAGDERQSINYALKAKSIAEAAHLGRSLTVDLLDLGDSYEKLNILDSALFYEKQGNVRATHSKESELIANTTNNLGNIYLKMHLADTASSYYHRALFYEKQTGNYAGLCETTLGLAKIFQQKGLQDSAIYYARQSIAAGWQGGFTLQVLKASQFLTNYFEKKGQLDSAFRYQKVSIMAKDSLFSQEKTSTFQNLSFAERQRQQDIQEQQAAYRARIRYYLLIAVIVFLLIMAFVFWRNNKQNKKAKTQIQQTLDELNTTQNQLVQSAKMASLGELTAGIAHEIQNPLNFVNNFSEVNEEMLADLKEELKGGKVQEALAMVSDIQDNERKIRHHGKRADFIVKGMMEHSRVSTGEKRITDINVLADEFLKLSYHGLRAKDKSLRAELVTNFDNALPRINVAQQDIGRVLANLYNNALYAVNQKAKIAGPDYQPKIEVSTAQQNGSVFIKIKDNGTGIPESIREKIMQPFFTTKPTGEGTGLGLSLSYDIVVKGHGGKIDLESKEGEGSEFTVMLPA